MRHRFFKRKPNQGKNLVFLRCSASTNFVTTHLLWAPTHRGYNLWLPAPTGWEHKFSQNPSTHWVEAPTSFYFSTNRVKAPTFRFYKHPLAEKETYVSLAPPYHPSLSKYMLLKSTHTFRYSLHTHSADLLCILYCSWSVALPHCPLQPILSMFSCHAESPSFLPSIALTLSRINSTNSSMFKRIL